MASNHSQPFQVSPNGPLSDTAIKRLSAVKSATGMSYAALGAKVGISGTFLYNLMNKGMNVGTQHIRKIEHAVNELETEKDFILERPTKAQPDTLKHSYNLRMDYIVSIELPVDISTREAERLCLFIQSLPSN